MRFGTLTLISNFILLTRAFAAAQPALSISDTQVVEGNSGITNAEFVITLSAPWTNSVTVTYMTHELPYDYLNQPYPATSGVDFIPTNGTLTFAPGQTNKSVFVQVIGDTINEADEPFGFYASVQQYSSSADARCTILDDDPLEIYINDTSVLEGPAGVTSLAQFTLTTYETTEQEVYCQASSTPGTATAGVDYMVGPIAWQIDPGPPRTNILGPTVPVIGDSTNEDDETFSLVPSLGFGYYAVRPYNTNPQNARGVVFLNQPKCTIINDDFYLAARTLSGNRTQLTVFGALNATHVLQFSSDLVNWTSFSTNTLDSSRQVSMTVTNKGKVFYRALRTLTLPQ